MKGLPGDADDRGGRQSRVAMVSRRLNGSPTHVVRLAGTIPAWNLLHAYFLHRRSAQGVSPMEVCSQSQRMRKSLPALSEFRRNRWWDEQTLIWTDRAPLGDVSRSMCSPPKRPPTTRLKEPS